MEINIDEIASSLIEELKKIPDGTETSTSKLLIKVVPDLEISDEDKMKIEYKLYEIADDENIIIDKSKHEGAFIGLPHCVSFIKRTK